MEKGEMKSFLLALFFPKFCLNCHKEGEFLCPDCKATLETLNFHKKFQSKNLSDLYFPLEYKGALIKNLIQRFKYEPFIKELAKDLAALITDHFQLFDNPPPFLVKNWEFILIPVPLEKRKLKWRGFNQAEEIGKEISKFLNIEMANDVLIKTKETLPQVELSEKERRENVKNTFLCQNPEKIQKRKILLIDDVYTTGSTMEECAKVLKKARTKEVIGIVIARAAPGQDQPQNV